MISPFVRRAIALKLFGIANSRTGRGRPRDAGQIAH